MSVAIRWRRLRYTLQSPFYDAAAAEHREPRRRAITLLALQPGESVLIVGAGTGPDLPLLPRQVEVLATDCTPAMLRRAERRAGAHVRLAVMDGERLDLPDASFDVVLLHQVLAVVPDPARCLREAARVVRPGGRVSVFDKFTPEGRRPAAWRRLTAPAIDVVFTVPKWPLGDVLARAAAPLDVVHEEPWGRGPFRIVLLRRRRDAPEAVLRPERERRAVAR